MASQYMEKKLFIIMPFGIKSGRLDHSDQNAELIKIDFDKIWTSIIQPSIPKDYNFKRADELKKSGLIDRNYIELLINSDIVLADLTFGNPNVYYELGMRHVLSKKGTVLIAQNGTILPFDVRNQSVLYYDKFDATSLFPFQENLGTYINNAYSQKFDSPVHIFFPQLSVTISNGNNTPSQEIEDLKSKNKKLEEKLTLIESRSEEQRLIRKINSTNNKSKIISFYGKIIQSSINSIEIYELIGIKLRKNSLFKEAIIVFTKALEIDSEDSEINREIGFTFRKLNDFKKAEKYFTKALSLNEYDTELLGMLGGMYKRNGNLSKSLSLYQRAHKIEPENLYSAINVATLTLLLEGNSKAIPVFQKVVVVSSNEIESIKKSYWSYFCMAQAYLVLNGSIEKVLEIYKKALEFNPPIEDLRSEYEQIDFLKNRNIKKEEIDEIQLKIFKPILE